MDDERRRSQKAILFGAATPALITAGTVATVLTHPVVLGVTGIVAGASFVAGVNSGRDYDDVVSDPGRTFWSDSRAYLKFHAARAGIPSGFAVRLVLGLWLLPVSFFVLLWVRAGWGLLTGPVPM